MAETDRDWQRWAAHEPYFGVLADPRFRRANLVEHRAEFFAEGQAYIAERLARIAQLFGNCPRDSALDFGCGVGRLTLPLAQYFTTVTGLDIAPKMLDEAKLNAEKQGLDNTQFLLCDDRFSAISDQQFDLVMSAIVFQHIPPKRGLVLLRALLDRVNVGGIAAIQICTDCNMNSWTRLGFALRRYVPGLLLLHNWRKGKPLREPMMGMYAYPLEVVLDMAPSLGFAPAIIDNSHQLDFAMASLIIQRVAKPS